MTVPAFCDPNVAMVASMGGFFMSATIRSIAQPATPAPAIARTTRIVTLRMILTETLP
jgi:hypothetical protein